MNGTVGLILTKTAKPLYVSCVSVCVLMDVPEMGALEQSVGEGSSAG